MRNQKYKVLLIENNTLMAHYLDKLLPPKDITLTHTKSPVKGLSLVKADTYDLILVDSVFPDIDGPEIIKLIRLNFEKIPIIFFKGKSIVDIELKGYQAGGNLFHDKPVNYKLLVVQISVLIKIYASKSELSSMGIKLDSNQRVIEIKGTKFQLTYKQYLLIYRLFMAEGMFVAKDIILRQTQKGTNVITEDSIEVLVYRLRKLLGDYGRIIESKPNLGYRINKSIISQINGN